jgi:hypothetical protein
VQIFYSLVNEVEIDLVPSGESRLRQSIDQFSALMGWRKGQEEPNFTLEWRIHEVSSVIRIEDVFGLVKN